MHYTTSYILALALAMAAAVGLVLLASRRHAPGAWSFVLLMSAVAVWSAGYILELGSGDLATKLLWAKVEYFGIVAVPAGWIIFALQYTRRERWLTQRTLAILAIEPMLVLFLIWTNEAHGWFWSHIRLVVDGSLAVLDLTYGVAFWLHVAYSYMLLLLGTLALLKSLSDRGRLYHGQVNALLIGVCAPWIANALFLANANPFPHLDLTPFAFTVTGIAFGWGLLRFHLLDIAPVAYSAVIQSMSDIVITLDQQNRVVGLNPAAQQLIGQWRAVVGQPIERLIAGWPTLAAHSDELTTISQEIDIGEGAARRIFDLRISPLLARGKRLVGRVAMLHDITEHKQLAAALRQSEEHYRILVQHLPTSAVFLFDHDLRYMLAEGTALARHGFEKSRIEGKTLGEVLPPERRDVLMPYYRAALAGSAQTLENTSADRTYTTQFVPITDASGAVVAGMAVSEDITERKRVEQALRSQKLLFENLVAVARATVAHPTLAATLQDALDIATKLTGAEHGSLFICDSAGVVTHSILARGNVQIEQRQAVIRQVLDEGLAGWVARERRAAIINDTAQDERWVQLPNAPYTARSVIAVPIVNGSALVGTITLHHGTTGHFNAEHLQFMQGAVEHLALAVHNAQLYDEQFRLTNELYQAKEAAEAANRAKGEFVSFVSHELKTPMTAIRGYADIMLVEGAGPISAAQSEFLGIIRSNVDLMATLVSDLADSAQIEAGYIRLEWSQIALGEIVEKIARSSQGQIESKAQTLELAIPPALPVVWGDRLRLTQIMSNLVSNACKYTPHGGRITISAEHTANQWNSADTTDVVHIVVQDTGIGIRAEDQHRIFEKFFRAPEEQARAAPGTGLGLNITKYLVEMQGGQIWFQSVFGHGTAFHFTIPVAQMTLQASEAPFPRSRAAGSFTEF